MKKYNKHSTTRRKLLKSSLAGTAYASMGFPSILRAEENIKIGIPTILSGRVAQLGISATNAIRLHVEKFNEEGGFNGRTIELIVRDSRAKPDEAARVTRDFINSAVRDEVSEMQCRHSVPLSRITSCTAKEAP